MMTDPTSTTLFSDWRDHHPVPIVPVIVGNTCIERNCAHIQNGYCPFWGLLDGSTIDVTAEEVWQHKGYCYFYE